MRPILSKIQVLLIGGLCFTLVLAACKKNISNEQSGGSTNSSTALSDEDSLKYLMYHIMQVSLVDGGRDSSYDLPSYFWYSVVPTLSPLSTSYATADNLLTTIKTYPINAQTGSAFDRYSFLDRTGSLTNELQNGVSGVVPTETTGDFGMEVNYAADKNNNTYLFVLYADKNAPAGKAGLQRGWEITAINGDTNISYDGTGYGDGTGTNATKVTNAIYYSTSVTLTLTTTNGTSVTTTLNNASYNINPVLYDTIYNYNSKKVGYFVFYTFPNIYNTSGAATYTKTVLDQTFQKFASAGVSELIVDLRYNGGGSVATAEYLDSAIAPASTKGKVMYNYTYNDKMTKYQTQLGLPSSIYFPGGGALSLNHVFFIVSENTASASELTLNNLKPYMSVKLVGDTTYGKPVGFLDFTISDHDSTGTEKYLADLYAINFATSNANGTGGYYTGIAPDYSATDYINLPWGSTSDANLAAIFKYISSGSFARTTAEEARTSNSANARAMITKSKLAMSHFNGMIDYKLSSKLKTSIKK